MQTATRADLAPQPFDSLLADRSRIKVFYGGRGSAKSWAVANTLIAMADAARLRILCVREFQSSMADSVHLLLSDRIEAMGLSHRFKVTQTGIVNLVKGSEFIFKGLRRNTQEIKSTEGIDICWVEEAQAVSKESWAVLTPTIRKQGSEIWVTFNPHLDTDATYQRFIVHTPPDCLVRKVNWDENPFFPETLRAEMEHCRRTDPDAYANVWAGECVHSTNAQVLHGKWVVDDFKAGGEGWDGPYYGADWGYSQDPTALTCSWVKAQRLYIEFEAGGTGIDLDLIPAVFGKVPGADKQLIRGDNSRPETIAHLNRKGLKVVAADKWPGSVEDGIAALRNYEQIIIHPRCKQAAQEARLWSYKTNNAGDVLPILKPGNDHYMDSIRYGLGPLIKRKNAASQQLLRL